MHGRQIWRYLPQHYDDAKDLGIKAKLFTEDVIYDDCWKTMKIWLNKYFLNPSPVHFITYCIPQAKEQQKTIKVNKVQSK